MTPTGRHVVLVGLMATGKSTVGALLADRLGRVAVDSDQQIEAAQGRSVREIFASDGEPAFRALETQALLDALEQPEPLVVAAAGGVVLDPANRRALADERCFVVWLRADPHVLAERASRADHRPLLDDDPVGRMQAMSTDREPLYAEVADAIIDLDDRTADAVADEVARLLPDPFVGDR